MTSAIPGMAEEYRWQRRTEGRPSRGSERGMQRWREVALLDGDGVRSLND